MDFLLKVFGYSSYVIIFSKNKFNVSFKINLYSSMNEDKKVDKIKTIHAFNH